MKKEYIAPSVKMVNLGNESLLYTASSGIGGDYEPGMPIDAKRETLMKATYGT